MDFQTIWNVQRQDISSNECTGAYFDKENLSCPGSSENRIVSSTTGKKIAQNLNMFERLIDARRWVQGEDDKTAISLFKYTEQKRKGGWLISRFGIVLQAFHYSFLFIEVTSNILVTEQ